MPCKKNKTIENISFNLQGFQINQSQSTNHKPQIVKDVNVKALVSA